MIDAVVDVSHYQKTIEFDKVARSGILGMIHKATQGHPARHTVDPRYASRKPLALKAGLLWGAYHFGTNEDGKRQAEHFLEIVRPGDSDLLVLDFEEYIVKHGKKHENFSMGLQQAEDFVRHVHQATGRYPGLYATKDYLLQNGAQDSPILQACWLWIVKPDDVVEPAHPHQWPTWTLWQHTNGKGEGRPAFAVDGIGLCDRDFFNGSVDDLRKLWGVAPAS